MPPRYKIGDALECIVDSPPEYAGIKKGAKGVVVLAEASPDGNDATNRYHAYWVDAGGGQRSGFLYEKHLRHLGGSLDVVKLLIDLRRLLANEYHFKKGKMTWAKTKEHAAVYEDSTELLEIMTAWVLQSAAVQDAITRLGLTPFLPDKETLDKVIGETIFNNEQ